MKNQETYQRWYSTKGHLPDVRENELFSVIVITNKKIPSLEKAYSYEVIESPDKFLAWCPIPSMEQIKVNGELVEVPQKNDRLSLFGNLIQFLRLTKASIQ